MTQPTPEPDHLFVVMWPIIDTALPTHVLVSEAGREMRRIAQMQRAQLIGGAKWVRRLGRDCPGSGGAEEVLICTVGATKIPREVDPFTGVREWVGSTARSKAIRSGAYDPEAVA